MEVKYGNQEPRIRYEQEWHHTDGDDAAMLSEICGLTPDPWQAMLLNAWLARDENDDFVHLSCGLSVPRQNGKNGVLEMRELYGLFTWGEVILHTAHRVDTAKKAFKRLVSFFENEDLELCNYVKNIRRTNGEETIELINGGMIEFSARTRGGARGASYGLVVYDEAQELTEEQAEAITSTLAASRNQRQFIYTGTPPGLNAPGDMFAQQRKAGLAGISKTNCWHEWSVAEIGDITDVARWYDTNPGMGYRLDEKFTAVEMDSLTKEGFARERLGWWQAIGGSCLFDTKKWVSLAAENPPKEGKMSIGVKFAVDGSTVSVALALKPKEGLPHVEALFNKGMSHGVSWISDFILARKDKIATVVIDGRSGTDTLVQLLRDNGFPQKAIVLPGTRGVIAASSLFFNDYQEAKLTHFNQELLNTAIANTIKRKIGNDGGWGYQGYAGMDITPVEACSLAYWSVKNTKRNPGRKAKVF